MTRRRAWVWIVSGPILLGLCGCAEIADSLVERAFGDNYGPVFTGEHRGEYRDRKEVERLGSTQAFEQKHGREPDLYWPERFKND